LSEGFIAPNREKHRAFQQKSIFVDRLSQSIEKPLDPVLNENKLEVCSTHLGEVEKPLPHGSGQITFGARLHVSASR
jgi:hypothetical protein